jgi:hypothetical protein
VGLSTKHRVTLPTPLQRVPCLPASGMTQTHLSLANGVGEPTLPSSYNSSDARKRRRTKAPTLAKQQPLRRPTLIRPEKGGFHVLVVRPDACPFQGARRWVRFQQ